MLILFVTKCHLMGEQNHDSLAHLRNQSFYLGRKHQSVTLECYGCLDKSLIRTVYFQSLRGLHIMALIYAMELKIKPLL